MLSRISIATLMVMACSSSNELPPASFGDVCGEDTPFRVLELEPGVRLAGAPRALAERIVIRVGKYGPPTSSGLAPRPEDTRLWSTGLCGEEPLRFDSMLQDIAVVDRWPDLLLGLRPTTRELTILDLTDVTDDHVVFSGVGPSALYWTEHGLVTFEARGENTGAALFHQFPDDPHSETISGSVLVESVMTRVANDRVNAAEFELLTDEMIVMTSERELVRASFVTGEATVEYTATKAFAVSPDGRWLLRQDLVGDPDDSTTPGTIFLRDLEGASEISLGDAYLDNTSGPFDMYKFGHFVVNIEPYANGKQRVFSLDDLSFVDLPEDRTLLHVFSDGRFAIGSLSGNGIDLFEPKSGERMPLAPRGVADWWGEDEFELIDVSPHWLPEASYMDEGPLFRVPGTGEPQLLADRASRVGFRRGDGTRFFGLATGSDLLGQLVMLRPDGAGSTLIDDRVFAYTARISTAFGDEALVYSVDDGARTGIWLARFED